MAKQAKNNEQVTVTELYESRYIIEVKDASCEIDDKEIPLAVHAEIIDMEEIDGADYDGYPYLIHYNIIPTEFHPSYKAKAMRGSGIDEKDLTKYAIMEECVMYGGGVPLNMIDSTKSNTDNFEGIDYRIARTQRGEYATFADFDSAEKYIYQVAANRISGIFVMIGFILDKQVNMIGNNGWDIISDCALGTDLFANTDVLSKRYNR